MLSLRFTEFVTYPLETGSAVAHFRPR